MKVFRWNKNKAWKEKVKSKTEQATVSFLTAAFQRIGINNACERLLAWSEMHRKMMFGITVSFLLLVTIFSITTRPVRTPMQVFNDEKSKVQINVEQLQKKQVGVSELLEVVKMRNEISDLQNKGELTKEDTLRIIDLYNRLNQLNK